jgi:hypothetical protein
VFSLKSGDPVFEVWFWHSELRRWFVLSRSFNTLLQAQGIVYFEDPAQLVEKIRALGGKIPGDN